MMVWLTLSRSESAANPTPQVFASAELAHTELERLAQEYGVTAGGFDLETDNEGRVLWFEHAEGNGPEAWIDGPLEVQAT